jgi:hypothetical protein
MELGILIGKTDRDVSTRKIDAAMYNKMQRRRTWEDGTHIFILCLSMNLIY